MAVLITPNIDEFCEDYSMNYEQTDQLKDVIGSCYWVGEDGELKGKLIGGSSQEVSTWIYLNLK